MGTVEEYFELKEVPSHKRVSLVATKFRGRGAAWWQQLKHQWSRQEKAKVESCEKLKKHIRGAFLPHNYTWTVYQQLQNVRQRTWSLSDYNTEFYQLLVQNDLSRTKEQSVSIYIRGLRLPIEDVLNMFDFYMLAEAMERALQVEKQLNRKANVSGKEVANSSGSGIRRVATLADYGTVGSSAVVGGKPTVPPWNRPLEAGFRCFKCGELGHQELDCCRGNEW